MHAEEDVPVGITAEEPETHTLSVRQHGDAQTDGRTLIYGETATWRAYVA